jgi:hypothetical protein
VVDGPFITSRMPDDLPVFCEQIIEMVAGEHGAGVRGQGSGVREAASRR